MTDEKKALILYRLECANEMLSDARLLVSEYRWKSVVSRLYYAVFQAVSALMIQESVRIRSHSGAKAMLELHFIKTGRIVKYGVSSTTIYLIAAKKVITAHS